MCIEKLIADHIRADVTKWIAALNAAAGTPQEETNGGSPELTDIILAARDLSFPFLDYEAAAQAAGWFVGPLGKMWTDDNGNWRDGPTEIARDFDIGKPHEVPIIGFYIVTAELADKLEARGERVERDFGGLIVWARKRWQYIGKTMSAFQIDPAAVPLDRDPVLLAIYGDA